MGEKNIETLENMILDKIENDSDLWYPLALGDRAMGFVGPGAPVHPFERLMELISDAIEEWSDLQCSSEM
jgi:hypothetical protein